jgi:hypothetical protein
VYSVGGCSDSDGGVFLTTSDCNMPLISVNMFGINIRIRDPYFLSFSIDGSVLHLRIQKKALSKKPTISHNTSINSAD